MAYNEELGRAALPCDAEIRSLDRNTKCLNAWLLDKEEQARPVLVLAGPSLAAVENLLVAFSCAKFRSIQDVASPDKVFEIDLMESFIEDPRTDFILTVLVYTLMVLAVDPEAILVALAKRPDGRFEVFSGIPFGQHAPLVNSLIHPHRIVVTGARTLEENGRRFDTQIAIHLDPSPVDFSEGSLLKGMGAGGNQGLVSFDVVSRLAGGSYAWTYLVRERGTRAYRVLKFAKGKGFAKLHEELAWLRCIAELKPGIRFSEVVDWMVEPQEKAVAMVQTYHPRPSITSLLLNQVFETERVEDGKVRGFIEVMERILLQFRKFHAEKISDTKADFFQKYHYEKISRRFKEILYLELPGGNFSNVVNCHTLRFHKERLIGPRRVVELLNIVDALTGLLRPPFLSMTHGDLNIGNILIQAQSVDANGFALDRLDAIFVDPRGWINIERDRLVGQDYMYDIAKMAYHILGCYDVIRAGWATVSRADPESNAFRWDETCQGPAGVLRTYAALQSGVFRYFIDMSTCLVLGEDEEKFLIRFFQTLGSCMVSDIPFLVGEPSGHAKALGILVLGTRFLNLSLALSISFLNRQSCPGPGVREVLGILKRELGFPYNLTTPREGFRQFESNLSPALV